MITKSLNKKLIFEGNFNVGMDRIIEIKIKEGDDINKYIV